MNIRSKFPGADTQPQLSRRMFLTVTALGTAGFLIGCGDGQEAAKTAEGAANTILNAFISINSDDTVTVLNKHIEFGQGTTTGVTTLVAEELDAAWGQMRFGFAPADNKLYGNDLMGGMQGTGGSSAMADSFEKYRKAAAGARAMLVAAAAAKFKVGAETLVVQDGIVSTADGKQKASFGALAADAAKIAPPDAATLKFKDPSQYRYVGKTFARMDTAGKVNGSAKFGLDYRPEGTLTALIAKPPRFGGKVKSFDATAAKNVAGVTDVVQIPQGVAVLAKDMWAAMKGREALKVEWDESAAEKRGSAEIMADYKKLAAAPGTNVRKDGDVAAALKGAKKTITAEFEFPYLAHACLETMNCTVVLKPDACEIWSGSQMPTADQLTAAGIAGLKPEQVKVHSMLAGGSFGRRITPTSDIVNEAVHIAKAIGGKAPVKLVHTREDDIRGGWYRPMTLHRFTAGFDAKGLPTVWDHRVVTQGILAGTPFLPPGQMDFTATEGSSTLPYAFPNLSVDVHLAQTGIPVLWWRAVGSTHSAYATEVFVDQVAREAKKDPVAFRRELLTKHPRHLGVLNLAAEKAGWDTPLPKGKARGIAVHESFRTFVAQVAEITVNADKTFTVDRVVCAVDCGVVVNPDVVVAQMEGGIGFGLSAILHEAVTLTGGVVDQSNFSDYTILRASEMPKIEVHVVPSTEKPTGVGEPGTPPIGPAVANALLAATGKAPHKLPMGTSIPA
jgi:isoquinoline 1-oxidoreductase beta subunit